MAATYLDVAQARVELGEDEEEPSQRLHASQATSLAWRR
jgi:hypothetical protein